MDWTSFQKALAALRRPGTTWSPDLHRQLDTYSGLIAEWGEVINVTGVRSPQALVDSLFVESLAGPAAFPELFGAGRHVADLGSGAGFPGMILALACPDLEVTLFEASRKKAAFLEEVRLRTDARVTVIGDRFETAAAAGGFDTVVSRAVERPERLGEAVARALAPATAGRPDGAWLLYGGPKMIERVRGMGEAVVRDALTVSVACLNPGMFHVKQ